MRKQEALRLRNRAVVLLRRDCAQCRVFVVWKGARDGVVIGLEHPRHGYMSVSHAEVV